MEVAVTSSWIIRYGWWEGNNSLINETTGCIRLNKLPNPVPIMNTEISIFSVEIWRVLTSL